MARDVSDGNELKLADDGFINIMPTTPKNIQQPRIFLCNKGAIFQSTEMVFNFPIWGAKNFNNNTRSCRNHGIKNSCVAEILFVRRERLLVQLRPDAKAWRCRDGDVTHPSLSTGNDSSATWFH